MPTEQFASDYWATSPLLTRLEQLGQGFDDLFSLDAADEILSSRGLRTPFIRIARDGAIVDATTFTGTGGVGATVADQVVDDRVMDLFASGHTVVLQALHRLWPPLVAFAGELGAELGHPVQVNAYITPKQSQGFAPHYDVHDVFVIQVAGSKQWTIHDPVHPDPLRSQAWTQHRAAVLSRAAGAPKDEHVLGPGDVLYLPRGFIHSAETRGEISAHLTVGIHAHSRHDLAEALLELALDDPRLRRTLPLGVDLHDPEQLHADLVATVAALVERTRSASPLDVARLIERRSLSGSRPVPVGPLAQAQALEQLDSETRVYGRPRKGLIIRESDDQVAVEHAGGTLTFPARLHPALTMLLDSEEPVRVGDLPGPSEEDTLELVERLMRAGAVVAERAE